MPLRFIIYITSAIDKCWTGFITYAILQTVWLIIFIEIKPFYVIIANLPHICTSKFPLVLDNKKNPILQSLLDTLSVYTHNDINKGTHAMFMFIKK